MTDSAHDPIDRAHLTSCSRPTPPVHRYPPTEDLVDLVRRHWVPVWSFPEGVVQTQRVLQYPICLVVVASDYARFYGVRTGLSTVDLEGTGWAVGTMLQPAAGRLLFGGPISEITDRHVELDSIPGVDGAGLTASIRRIMSDDPSDSEAHRAAVTHTEEQLRRHLPVDDDGIMVNEIVEMVEVDPTITRVDHLCDVAGMSERRLQRLTRDSLGLTPKWLIQRRRLHEAVLRLKQGEAGLAQLAVELGYADQAHFSNDFARVTGITPGSYASDQPEADRDG